MQLAEIFEKVKAENARSKEEHGSWVHLDTGSQNIAIFDELIEWNEAQEARDTHGGHGEINEAIHVINVMARRIMYLTGEPDA
jgi:hypothetical protein